MIQRISYSEQICKRVWDLRANPLAEIAAMIAREFRLYQVPSRYTIGRILQREGRPLLHHTRAEEKQGV